MSDRSGLLSAKIAGPLLLLLGCASMERSLVEPETWTLPTEGVAVTRASIRVGGEEIRLPIDEAQLVSVLGQPDRREQLNNRILVWDRLGIFAYENPDADVIDAIALSFSCSDMTFCPKQGYPGVFLVGNAVFWHAPVPRHIVRYRFRSDELACFKNIGRYRVAVDCLDAGPGLGTFEVALKE